MTQPIGLEIHSLIQVNFATCSSGPLPNKHGNIITWEIQKGISELWSMGLAHGQDVLNSERKIKLEQCLSHFTIAFALLTPYRCSTRIWKMYQSDSGTHNVTEKLRLSTRNIWIGGAGITLPRLFSLLEILMEGRRRGRERETKTEIDRLTERDRDRERRGERFIRNKM